jgi:hypothetical protein
MNYVIYFSNPTEYAQALAQSGGTGVLKMTPRLAASTFGIPFPYPTLPIVNQAKGLYFISPFFPGQPIFYPNNSGIFVDDTVLNTTVPAQAGNPASIWPANSPFNDGVFTWSANIILNNGAGAVNNPPVNPISQRRWIWGRELSNGMEPTTTGFGAFSSNFARDCSRSLEGIGLSFRPNVNLGQANISTNSLRSPTNPRTSWERFYIRLRARPLLGNVGFWRTFGTSQSAVGFMLFVDTTGNLHVGDVSATDKGILLQAAAGGPKPQFEFNKWFRIDVFLRFNDSPTNSISSFYVNGTPLLTASHIGGFSTTHGASQMGVSTNPGSDHTFEIDIDDWSNMELPANVSQTALTFNDANYPLDWLMGSHIVALNSLVNAGTTQVNWAPSFLSPGSFNELLAVQNRVGNSILTSSTSGARIAGVTDAPPQNSPQNNQTYIGASAAVICLWQKNAGPTNGQLGYKLAGGADVLSTVTQTTAESGVLVPYFPSGMLTPAEIAPFSVVHTKSADANLDTSVGLSAIVEYLGVFGPEDDPTWTFPDTRLSFLHNHRYPGSAWGNLASSPPTPVYAIGMTYGGNGAYQEFTIPGPIHFMLVRPLSGSPTGGFKYMGACLNGRVAIGGFISPNFRTWYDFPSGGTFKFSFTGDSIEFNSNGVSYQAIIFCDPGMRYCLNGSFSHNGDGTFKNNTLPISTFTALAGFFGTDALDGQGSAGIYYKGAGITGNQGMNCNGGALDSNIGAISTGSFTSGNTLNGPLGAMNSWYNLWRTSDAGLFPANVMIQILSYVGNGTNPRTITLAPTSLRFPLFVMVGSTSGGGVFYRDPSHTSTNSCNFSNLANSTSAIVGVGVDSITVNNTLNVNGVTYTVFAIAGDTAGMNNGTFFPTFSPATGPYNPPDIFNGITVLGNGGLVLDGPTASGLLKDVSGLYTLTAGKRNDTFQDRQSGQTTVDLEIPDPTFKTGYLGG